MPKYTVKEFFSTFSSIKATPFARKIGINPALMRHYAAGIAEPGKKNREKIQKAIKEIGKELKTIKIH